MSKRMLSAALFNHSNGRSWNILIVMEVHGEVLVLNEDTLAPMLMGFGIDWRNLTDEEVVIKVLEALNFANQG